MRIFDAIWAFRYHGVLPENLENAIFGHSLKTYGRVYLVVAIVLILCSVGVSARSQISRWIGIFAGAVMAISFIWWMPYYPIWSLTYHFHWHTRHLRPCRLRRARGDNDVTRNAGIRSGSVFRSHLNVGN